MTDQSLHVSLMKQNEIMDDLPDKNAKINSNGNANVNFNVDTKVEMATTSTPTSVPSTPVTSANKSPLILSNQNTPTSGHTSRNESNSNLKMFAPLTKSIPVHNARHLPSLTSSTRSVHSTGSSIMETDVEEDGDGNTIVSTDLAGLVVGVDSRANGGSSAAGPEGNDNSASDANSLASGYLSSANTSVSTSINSNVNLNAVAEKRKSRGLHSNMLNVNVNAPVHSSPLNPRRSVVEEGGLSASSSAAQSGQVHVHGHQNSHHQTNVAMGLMRGMEGIKGLVEAGLKEVKDANRRDFDRVFTALQHEAAKRSALEQRLHSQLLLQSETMIAMEVKLLRLEAKVERREASQKRRLLPSAQQPSFTSDQGRFSVNLHNTMPTLPTIAATSNTIDEEDDCNFETMEIRVSNSHNRPRDRIGVARSNSGNLIPNPTNIAVVSSGASLASAVTATSFLDGEGSTMHADAASARSDDGDVEDEGDGGPEDLNDGSASTPTQGSRHFTNLESILLNPINTAGPNEHGMSTRATRGDTDGNSSLATSVTNTTITSTVVTATTRGGDSINPRSMSALTHDEMQGEDDDGGSGMGVSTVNAPRGREDLDSMLGLSPPTAEERPRSRSQSPLTVQSAATASVGQQSMASASVGTSIITTAAVAPARSFRARREAAARLGNLDSRPLANRVVSFTSNEIFGVPPEISEAGDSITMPDELDNLSATDVADAFADRARLWREEYEARLDAIQKRFGAE